MRNRWQPSHPLTASQWLRRVWSCWRPRFIVRNSYGQFWGLLVYKPLSTWRGGWQDWRVVELRWLRWVPLR